MANIGGVFSASHRSCAMPRAEEVSQRPVWAEEAAHRAANLRHLATNLDRLFDDRKIDSGNRARALARASALMTAYQNLDVDPVAESFSCAKELKDIASGLVEIYGHTVGSVVLSLELQPILLAGEARRALVLATSELVVNALRHAFIDRQTGTIEIRLYRDHEVPLDVLIVADDGVGMSGSAEPGGTGHGIVRDLAKVLGGEVVWRQSPLLGGAEAMLRFPAPESPDA
jgi:two-component sensor histidine kinase